VETRSEAQSPERKSVKTVAVFLSHSRAIYEMLYYAGAILARPNVE
jgi:hypothetical protein